MACKLSEALARASRRLAEAGVDGARQDATILLSHVTGLTRSQLVTESENILDREAQDRLDALVTRRAAREPVSHILGLREFWSLPFFVSGAVLDPRPDSETLVEAALHYCPDTDGPFSILDLGTGSGCLLLSLLSECPNATGLGVDISAAALAIARCNASRLDLTGRARFLRGDWAAAVSGTFDVIICNPPYIATADMAGLAPEVAEFEPPLALDGGADGLTAYRRLIPQMRNHLSATGIGIIETGAGQREDVIGLMANFGLAPLEVRRDLAGIDRCIIFRVDPIFTDT